MVASLTEVVQWWLGLQAPGTQTASPSSGTAVNGDCWLELEVYPPVEAEYSVVAIWPPGMTITWPAVSLAAATLAAVSYSVPRYVWQVRSQVSA